MEYKLTQIEDKIHAVTIKSKYDRAMLFCKVQEFYESPNPTFRGQYFSIWQYMRWYSLNNKKGFTYALDWSGFNIPIKIVENCYHPKNPYRNETPYDNHLQEIVGKIKETDPHNAKLGYLIGTDSLTSETFEHEVRHAKYLTDKNYKKKVDKVVQKIKTKYPQEYKVLRDNIVAMGYSHTVVDDEIQAYIQDRTTDEDVVKTISKAKVFNLKSLFK
jgi:hypothetical protein